MQEFVWNSFTTEARGGSIEEKEEIPVHNSGISFHYVFVPIYPYFVPTNNSSTGAPKSSSDRYSSSTGNT